jgi:hypothetical protein
MHILSQVISASLSQLKWSESKLARGHIQKKICNKPSLETTMKLVYVYSNSKMAATVSDACELKMHAWVNEHV